MVVPPRPPLCTLAPRLAPAAAPPRVVVAATPRPLPATAPARDIVWLAPRAPARLDEAGGREAAPLADVALAAAPLPPAVFLVACCPLPADVAAPRCTGLAGPPLVGVDIPGFAGVDFAADGDVAPAGFASLAAFFASFAA